MHHYAIVSIEDELLVNECPSMEKGRLIWNLLLERTADRRTDKYKVTVLGILPLSVHCGSYMRLEV